jgi:predicted metallo-beta-lactamase superfamily hydrolase
MRIEILGAESLGVRGLSCIVEVEDRRIVIDPGLALGYRRYGLLPHPAQVAVGERVRQKIIGALKNATDVVISHYHGDHIPLHNANPFQIKAQEVAHLFQPIQVWAKGPHGLTHTMALRREALQQVFDRDLPNAEAKSEDCLAFSPPVPHGGRHRRHGMVMMTRIAGEGDVFVHASDIQLLDDDAVSVILHWQPTIVLAAGPPLYLSVLSREQRQEAWRNALRLAQNVPTLILDHHLLRSELGLSWLDRLSSETDLRVLCAADFMKCPRCLLEAERAQMYDEIPVHDGWHEAYARGDADTCGYRDYRTSADLNI